MSVAIGELIKLVLLEVGVKGGPDSFSVGFFGTTVGQIRILEPLLGSELLRFVATLIVSPILVGVSIFITSGSYTYYSG